MDQFLYELFRLPSARDKEGWDTEDHHHFVSRAAVVSSFLRGRSTRAVSDILELWIRHPYGVPDKDSPEMFSLTSERRYSAVRAVRPALTSFGVQIVQQQLSSQMREAVKSSSGLHVHILRRKILLAVRKDKLPGIISAFIRFSTPPKFTKHFNHYSGAFSMLSQHRAQDRSEKIVQLKWFVNLFAFE